MRKFILLTFALFSFSTICRSQDLEDFLILEKNKNITDVQFGKNNNLFVLGSDKQVRILSIDLKIQLYSFDVSVNSMRVSSSAEVIAFGQADGTLLFFNQEKQIESYKAHNNSITFIAFSPSDKFFATSGLDSKIKIWSAETYDLLQEIDVKSDLATDIKFSVDEKFLVYSTSNGKIIVWDLKDKKIRTTQQISNKRIRHIAISPDSIKYAVCGDDKKITILSFKDNNYYQLEKSHGNIITHIQFINPHYLLSIGHDHRITMNSIHIPTKKEDIKHFGGHPKYKKPTYGDLQGDKYFSNLSISEEKNLVAISSFGKGIAITSYFHDFIKKSHKVTFTKIDNVELDTLNVMPEFTYTNTPCVISGKITRPESIKNAWLRFAKDDKRIKFKVDEKGSFKLLFVADREIFNYSIIIEDKDENLGTSHYDFKLINANDAYKKYGISRSDLKD